MFRYAVVFGLLGFLISTFMGFVGETDLTEVLLRSMFWGVCFTVAGASIGFVAGKVVSEVDLPSDQEEADAQRYERRMREYLQGADTRGSEGSSDNKLVEVTADDDKANTDGSDAPVPIHPGEGGA